MRAWMLGLVGGCVIAVAAAMAWAKPATSGGGVPPEGAGEKPAIKIGQSAPLTGQTASLGLRVRAGLQAAVAEVNRTGGIDGRLLTLVSLDDGYEPKATGVNMRRLIDEEQVLVVLGSVGAPCAVTAVPIAQEKKTLLYGYFTGGSVLRKVPPDRYVVNFRAGLTEEAAEQIQALCRSGIRPDEIAFFTQRDAFGDAAFTGGVAALRSAGLTETSKVRHVRYERNTVNIESGLSELLLMQPQPKAVVFAGAGDPTVAFVRAAHKVSFRPTITTFSFADAVYIAAELGSQADGMIVTQVVPPLDAGVPAIEDYRKAMTAVFTDEQPSYASLEAYLSARALFRAMKACPGDLSREAVVEAIRGLGTLDAGLGKGFELRMRADGHTIGGHIWPTVIRGGKVVPLDQARTTSTADGAPAQPTPAEGR